ncbi:hypothetical protein R3W88_025889 [Solanum pinnatisectum]|uniref:Uncharacterized protein n=1 Tax=Solanum pinnatisectum TaxID=50273 RepID=A0AAV9M504_9SOLN|nr:hypothetical protein R3W88_025889 [Solanum pinnatisectum]
MAQNEIEEMLDHLRRIKNGHNLHVDTIDEIEILEMELRFWRTFIKYHHVLLPDSLVKLVKNAKLFVRMLHRVFDGIPDECKINVNLERLVSELLKFTDGNITILRYDYEFLRYLYATEINGCVDHEKLECLKTRIQFMANNVGQFCLDVSVYVAEFVNNNDEAEDDILNKPPYLLCLIVLVELEMK